MYGYIKVFQPDLKFREFDIYQSHYCGLCQTLKKNFGLKGQITLSYDLTFLSLLLDSLYEPKCKEIYHRCALHMGKRKVCYYSSISDYIAEMNLILSYEKAIDDWKDEHNILKKIFSLKIKKNYNKLSEKYPEKISEIKKQMNLLSELETSDNIENPEIPANCFGNILAEIMDYNNDIWSTNLRKIGFYIGKFIYLLDAYDDLENDKKKNSYNPFKNKDLSSPEFHKNCEDLLRIMIAECASAFEQLPIIKNASILRNIIYAGVWQPFYKKKKEYEMDNNPQ
ncbi:MAG: hypothetical protein IJZ64_02560 [Ruminococcus sp.]|nr:hypothetical protein [Ruminococcus sp.]